MGLNRLAETASEAHRRAFCDVDRSPPRQA